MSSLSAALPAPSDTEPRAVRPWRLGPRGKVALAMLLGGLPYLAVLPTLQAAQAGWMALAALLSASALGVLAWRSQREAGAQVARCLALVADIEQGRLNQVAGEPVQGELAGLHQGLLRLAAAFSAIVADVRTSAALVEQAGHQLARDQAHLAGRTEQQAANLEETAASVQQLAGTVQQNARAAQDADAGAARVRSAADSGASAMEVAVGSVAAIQQDTARVRELVGVIDAIAFQTNVLALNAAVEAARAGERGRGFAVVAAEVRHLAQRCAAESRQIRDLVETSGRHVDEGARRIRSAADEIAAILEGVRGMAAEMSRISTASGEQSTGLAEISRAVSQLETITQSNAQMVDDAARQSAALQERASTLSRSVQHFRLAQGTASEALALVDRARAAATGRSRDEFLRVLTEPRNGFHDRDMYVFALDRQGSYLAFGGNPGKVGTRVQDIRGVNGQALLEAIVRQGDREPGWVEYDIVNPLTRRVEPKMSYVVKLGDLYVGCGVYQSLARAA